MRIFAAQIKNYMKKISLVLVAVLAVSFAFAQKDFQGVIKYDYETLGEGAEQMAAFSPTGMELTISKKGMIVEMEGGMAAMMMGKILTTKKGGYMIKDAEKAVYKLSVPEEDAVDVAPTSVEKNG